MAVTGSSGLIGTALCAYLSTGGHRVIRLVRGEPVERTSDAGSPIVPTHGPSSGVDAVVHLAGASIAGRFTAAHKRLVYDSRVGPTAALARAMADADGGPRVFVCGSAIGFYGTDRGDELLTRGCTGGCGLPGRAGGGMGGGGPARP